MLKLLECAVIILGRGNLLRLDRSIALAVFVVNPLKCPITASILNADPTTRLGRVTLQFAHLRLTENMV